MLRAHIQAGDAIGQESENLLRSGKLVPDDMANRLVEIRLKQPDCDHGVILDGYPRTVNQAEVLLKIADKGGFRPAVIHLVVDYEKIVARLSGRRQCPLCGTLYSLTTNPPKVAGICDLDGTPLVTREDDRESVIRQRLKEYDLWTRPLLDFFRTAGVPMFEINGADAAPDEIMREICGLLVSNGFLLNGAGQAPIAAPEVGVKQ